MGKSWLRSLGRSARSVSSVLDIPIVGDILGATPFLGTGLQALDIAGDLIPGGGKKSQTHIPMPNMPGPGLPVGTLLDQGPQPIRSSMAGLAKVAASPSMAAPGGFSTNGTANIPYTARGPMVGPARPPLPGGTTYGMATADYVKQFALPAANLRTALRAPKGYVIIRDANGNPFGVLKEIARSFKLWKPKKKPPISVRDWTALKRADSTVRKLKRVVKMSKAVSYSKPRRAPAKCA